MSTSQFSQCTLQKRRSVNCSAELVSFIPTRFAKPGTVLKLKQADESWEDGWIVIHVGETYLHDEMPDPHRGIKRHRQTTGDALGRRS